jgi:transcriptional regulator with XRE-family HTH domain
MNMNIQKRPDDNANLLKLAEYVKQLFDRQGLHSFPDMVDKTGVSTGALHGLLNAKSPPRPATLKKIAETLEGDLAWLLYHAGHLREIPTGHLEPRAARLAQRITALMPLVQDAALDALEAQLDAICRVAVVEAPGTSEEGQEGNGGDDSEQENASIIEMMLVELPSSEVERVIELARAMLARRKRGGEPPADQPAP